MGVEGMGERVGAGWIMVQSGGGSGEGHTWSPGGLPSHLPDSPLPTRESISAH